MEHALLALAPAVPTPFKVGITSIMFICAFGLTASACNRKMWKPKLASSFLVVSVAAVVGLDYLFPDTISPGFDGRGVLAALIGLAVGVMSVPWSTRALQQQ